MKLTTTTWWILGGISLSGLGAYWLWTTKKKKQQRQPIVTNTSSTPVRVFQGGKATVLVTPDWNNPFDMDYIHDVKKWLGAKPIKELDKVTAKKFALQLKAAHGHFNDDEEAVGLIFQKQLKDKTQVASIAKAFYSETKMDLWKFLRSFLSTNEFKTLVHDPVKSLEKYRLA